jgi:hypothetical protein
VIPRILRDFLPRLWLVAAAGFAFYLFEPAFHRHGPVDPGVAAELGPAGLAATLANLAGLSMVILLAGFVSRDRRRGYYRMLLAHPVNPLALYGLRWLVALLLALAAAGVFLVVGQLAAWGEWRGGAEGLWLALLSALVYGGLMAFLSTALPRGDAWVAVGLFLLTFVWLQALGIGAEPFSAPLRRLLTFVLPPQTSLQDVYNALLGGGLAPGASAYAAGYGVFWLGAAATLLRVREWP